jgi:hypothetical protein
MKRVRRWFWGRLTLLQELGQVEKSLLAALHQLHQLEQMWDQFDGCYQDLLAEVRVKSQRLEAQDIMLRALGSVTEAGASRGD